MTSSTTTGGHIVIDGTALSVADIEAIARHREPIRVGDEALQAMGQTRRIVEAAASDTEPHYGVSTGFGSLARTPIPPAKRAQLQLSLVRSHAAGTGPIVETEVVRGMMALRLRTLCSGRTGVRPAVARAYGELLNCELTPVVHEYGSLGCSGDLAPLAACALALMGEGDVLDAAGNRIRAATALAAHGLTPVELAEKEGLALINGTDGMLAMLMLSVADTDRLVRAADVAAAMSVEALLGTDSAFAADLLQLRPQPGQQLSAANLRALLAGSPIVASHQNGDCLRVQDAYSLRCAPQVHGATRDTLDHAARVAAYEAAAAIDNPVIAIDGRIVSNGNFHGAPVALGLDFLAIALADLASISERRIDRLLDKDRSDGLPPFLAQDAGVDSGLMIAQYTAAGMVSELKRLAVPASVDSIPSSGMQEDHVSMGWAAGRKLRRAVDAARRVIAIELLAAARALDQREALLGVPPARGTAAARDAVRLLVAGPGPDRHLAPEIEAVAGGIDEILQAVTTSCPLV